MRTKAPITQICTFTIGRNAMTNAFGGVGCAKLYDNRSVSWVRTSRQRNPIQPEVFRNLRVSASSRSPMTTALPAVQKVLVVSAPAPSILSAQSIVPSNLDGCTKSDVNGTAGVLRTSSPPVSFLVCFEPSPFS